VDVDDFAEEDGAAVAELGDEVAELMAGVGLGEDFSVVGGLVAGENLGGGFGVELLGVEAEFFRELGVELDEGGGGGFLCLAFCVKTGQGSGVGVVELEVQI